MCSGNSLFYLATGPFLPLTKNAVRAAASTAAIIAVNIVPHGVDEAGSGIEGGVIVGAGVGVGGTVAGVAGCTGAGVTVGAGAGGATVVNVPVTQALVSVISLDLTLQ